MAPSEDPSNLRVFVHWHDQTIFAGEEVKCTITFKNVASDSDRSQKPPPSLARLASSALSPRATKANQQQAQPPSSTANTRRGHHRSALSASLPPGSRGRSASIHWPAGGGRSDSRPGGHAHKRSVSIVSIGSAAAVEDQTLRNERPSQSSSSPRSAPQRPGRGHARASSLQILPHRQSPSSPAARTPAGPPSASFPPNSFDRLRNGLGSPNPSAALDLSRKSSRSSPRPMPEFRFPAASPTSSEAAPPANPSKTPDQGLLSPTGAADQNGGGLPTRNSRTQGSPKAEKPQPAARILASNTMTEATPRSSGEFYAVSNHSSETLASEYISHPHSSKPLSHLRRQSSLAPQKPHSPEMLMMGYVQIQGSFTLDGSLVDLTPFELVKKKAVVGGRGGGVVGLEPSRQRESGLFRGLGWSNISNSLGDLLGGNELSTIREMRGVANSKAVPLLSTSQSILFVDLRLAPGESRSFEYTTRLPRGLPPSHKGKAMKISYSLVIGTQKAGGPKEQQVRSVEAPFRVLGGVNSSGEILGHDLMQPYILLRDEAKIKTLGGVNGGNGGSNSLGVPRPPFTHKSKALSRAPATMNDFLTYVDELVTGPRDENSGQLLSPSGPGSLSRRGSGFGPEDGVGGTTSSSDAIHFAIMRSNMTGEGQQSPNRFEISRNGQRVGVVMLTRPSYRLGETITMAIDLTGADMACYAVHTTLETCERVDPSLAVRSESSIQRVTRKVYVTSSDTTLYSRRVVFTPTIPISATPEFVTSGISLEWKIRVEFVIAALTPQQQQQQQQQQRRRRRQQQRQRGEEEEEDDDDDDDDYINGVDGGRGQPASHPLLEQISQDERGGLVLAAAENLACESFDVMVPLRVYGAVGSGLERLERDEASEEGLVV